MNTQCIILAGGWGSRLAPLTSPEHPKFKLKINGISLLQHTINRNAFLGIQNIHIISAPPVYKAIEGHAAHIEEEARGTASAINWIATRFNFTASDILIIVPADHMIHPTNPYQDALQTAAQYASEHPLLCLIGIKPTALINKELGHFIASQDMEARGTMISEIWQVHEFVEKPDVFVLWTMPWYTFWNAGIFIASVATFHQLLDQYWDGKEPSFDRAVVTPAAKDGYIAAVELDCYWNDVGTFDRLRKELF